MARNELGFLRTIGYYSIGLILPFVFARAIITLMVNVLSFDGIFYKKRDRDLLQGGIIGQHIASPINESVNPFIRGSFGLIMPWWLLKFIFGRK